MVSVQSKNRNFCIFMIMALCMNCAINQNYAMQNEKNDNDHHDSLLIHIFEH